MLTPDSECRIRSSAFGSTASDSGLLGAAVEHRGNLALAAQPAGVVPAEPIATHCFECRFHDCPLSSESPAYQVYTNNFETDVSS